MAFIIFSILGWGFESCIIKKSGLERGDSVIRYLHLSLPLLTVYGVGGMIVVYIAETFGSKMTLLPLALFAAVMLTLLECVAGLASRAFFKRRTWDYSADMLPMCNNYVSLRVSLFWFVAVLVLYSVKAI